MTLFSPRKQHSFLCACVSVCLRVCLDKNAGDGDDDDVCVCVCVSVCVCVVAPSEQSSRDGHVCATGGT